MKRNLFFLFAVLATTFASATVTSSNTLCWIKVNNTCTNVVISTALVDVGLPATNSIDVSNFILTKNLRVGDSLLKKVLSDDDPSDDNPPLWSWQGWAVVNAGTDEATNLVWQATGVTSVDRQFAAATNDALVVANAFVLHRSDPVASNPIYIRGQVECSVARTQEATEQITLMANAGLTDVYIEDIPWEDGKGPADGDKIRFLTDNAGTGTVDYTWKADSKADSNKWCLITNTLNPSTGRVTTVATPIDNKTVVVPVGQGFYFTRKVPLGATAPTVTW